MNEISLQTADELTMRWHDQTLDLQSLHFDKATGQCVFTITERKEETPSTKWRLISREPLQHCRVTITNVTGVEVHDAEGEAELYINRIESSPDMVRIRATNGTIEVTGEKLCLSLHALDAPGESEVKISTPVGEISWRRKVKS